jgi:outer membrane receptor protein involved in Fe transport
MTKPFGLSHLLLFSTALVAPAAAFAQTAPAEAPAEVPPADAPAAEAEPVDPNATPPEEAPPEVSVPGGEIVVTGRRQTNISRSASEVVSVLSTADIARTGEGDIAGALSRVTGLSVVGSGFVYVRGLGDRYSLALLNGSPLSSPEPLKRVVPLDLFPTNIVASSLVQKSYSANFPGEFGGGVINLTTKSIPQDNFISFSMSGSGDTETTNQLGYTYYGSSIDWTGFTNDNRNNPPALQAFLNSGNRISEGNTNTSAIVAQLFNGRNSVVQKNENMPANGSLSLSGGASWPVGDATMGVIATLGYSNKWRTRDTIQQSPASLDLSQKENDFRRVITDNRIVLNGLFGLGFEFDRNKIRLTSLMIRDTLKQARLGEGTKASGSPTATYLQQNTAWFERQLLDSHITAEFKLGDNVTLDVRGGYANAKREAPMEYGFEYFRSNLATDPFGAFYINRLNNGQQGDGRINFSNLEEDLWSSGVDLGYRVTPQLRVTAGYAFLDVERTTERREFLVSAPNTLPIGVALLRPDLLLGPEVARTFGIGLIDSNEANPLFLATLRNHAGYGQFQWEITPKLSLNAGVRYETAKQTVSPVQVFRIPTASLAGTVIDNDYWLPAATLTYQITPEMQLRINASKTIARPQFRELIFQRYFDPDSNRLFNGNPLLSDSTLQNAEVRYEWYFAREQRLSLAGFYKKIDRPIEAFVSLDGTTAITSFANAPTATLYGGEFEVQKYFDLDDITDAKFLASRRIVAIVNYTYTKSKIKVGADDRVAVFAQTSTRALDYFRDGSPLTGQSDHLVNLQLGLEDKDKLSQQTILLTYASDRVTSRGAGQQPDIKEKPSIRLDFVAREGVKIAGVEAEISFEARNLTGTKYQEFQQSGDNVVFANLYRLGTSVELGVNFKF